MTTRRTTRAVKRAGAWAGRMVRRPALVSDWLFAIVLATASVARAQDVPLWGRFEATFSSATSYDNPLYDSSTVAVHFTSPAGRRQTVNAFWDGERTWKVRFMPGETGTWSYATEMKATPDSGLHARTGTFRVASRGKDGSDLLRRGSLRHASGSYHLSHADGTPFFWAACTAWNGALKSTDAEWDTYLDDRVKRGYSVIQFVTTQWRGQPTDERGEVAFEGAGRIRLNPSFFQRLDRKIDRINERGLVAAPVVLWALAQGAKRELSPGYYLPENEAVLLARYIVARYGAHHVVWLLGGDGLYNNRYEQRWKYIGRGVFGAGDFQGVVATHSQGKSWIGREYADERWLEVLGYQSGHSADEATVRWITAGPVSQDWAHLPPRPLINMEPAYEQSARGAIGGWQVRNASYWSVFAAPVAGITYGANAIWPWSRSDSEPIFGHGDRPAGMTWQAALALPGGVQVGYLAAFMRQLPWWELRPVADVVLPSTDKTRGVDMHVPVLATADRRLLLAYFPKATSVRVANPSGAAFHARWFDPSTNHSRAAWPVAPGPVLEFVSPFAEDGVLVLEKR